MADKIQNARDTSANWTANNPVLPNGMIGYETDTKRLKFGDGVSAWNSLLYFGSIFGTGVFGSRPAAATTNAGHYYISTDESPNRIYRSTGTNWVDVGGGTSTDPHVATVDPTTADNAADGYLSGTRWVNTASQQAFLLVDADSGLWSRVSKVVTLLREPTNNDDVSAGYRVGDFIIADLENGVSSVHICKDDTASTALWENLTPVVFSGIGTSGDVPAPSVGTEPTAVLHSTGEWATPTGLSPQGVTGAVQYNDAGAFAAGPMWNSTEKTLIVEHLALKKQTVTNPSSPWTPDFGAGAVVDVSSNASFTMNTPGDIDINDPVSMEISVTNSTGSDITITLHADYIADTDIMPNTVVPAAQTIMFTIYTNDGGADGKWRIVGNPDYREYPEKTALVAADLVLMADSEASHLLKRVQRSNLISGVAAPTTVQYVTLATDAGLSNERVLTPGTGLTGTDGGAGSTYTLAMNINGLTPENTVDSTNDKIAFYDSSASAIRATAIANIQGSGGGGSVPTTFVLDEPFIMSTTSSGAIGLYGWSRSTGAFAGATTPAGSLGAIEVTSTATANAVAYITLSGLSNGFYPVRWDTVESVLWRLYPTSNAAVAYRFGLINPVSESPPATGVYFAFVGGTDTVWQCAARDGTNVTGSASGIAPSTTTMASFKIRKSGSSVVFSINGTDCSTISATLPSAGSLLAATVQVVPTSTIAKSVIIDHMRLVTNLTY